MIVSQDPEQQLQYQKELEDDAHQLIITLTKLVNEKYQKKLLIFEPTYKIMKEILKKTISLVS